MNEEDLSEIMKKITNMINTNNSSSSSNFKDNNSNNLNNYDDYKTNQNDNSNVSETQTSNSNNNFNIDIETLFKVKNIMDKMNSNQNNARSNLLLSLKPYLKPSRKDKVDQYIQLLNMGNIIEMLRQDENNSNNNRR